MVNRSLAVSLLEITGKYVLFLILLAGLFFVLAIVFAIGRNLIVEHGRFNDMMGFLESIIAVLAYLYVVCPMAAIAYIIQVFRLVGKARRKSEERA